MQWISTLLLFLLLLLLSKMARGTRSRDFYYYYYYETSGTGSEPGSASVVVWTDNDQHHWTNVLSNKPSNKPSQKCPENAEFTDCLSPCPWTCDRIKQFQFFAEFTCPGFCRPGCACKPGYVLVDDRKCVTVASCFMWGNQLKSNVFK